MDEHAKAEAIKRARDIIASMGIKLAQAASPAPPPPPPPAPPSPSPPPPAPAAPPPSHPSTVLPPLLPSYSSSSASNQAATPDAPSPPPAPRPPASLGSETSAWPEAVRAKMQQIQASLKEKCAQAKEQGLTSCIDQVQRMVNGESLKRQGGEEGSGHIITGQLELFPPSLRSQSTLTPYPVSFLFLPDGKRQDREGQSPQRGLPAPKNARRTDSEIWL
jgi:hypothetical protein